MRLSPAQIDMLAEVSNGPVTQIGAQMLSRAWKKTLCKLESLGLVVFQPYAFRGIGVYKITAEGREHVAKLLASGKLVKVPEKE